MDILIAVPISVVVGLIVGIVVSYIWDERLHPRLQAPRLRSLLKFNHGRDILVVYPPRIPGRNEPILPDVSIEDFMAVYNLQRLLASNHWSPEQIRLKDMGNLITPQDQLQNLILLCAPWRNDLTEEALVGLDKLISEDGISMKMVTDPATFRDIPQITFRGGTWTSPTHSQIDELQRTGQSVPEGRLIDYGIIISARAGEWEGHGPTLIIAGLRGIGTWGAMNHLRQNANSLARRAGPMGFAMVVEVEYVKLDIKSTREVNFAPFE